MAVISRIKRLLYTDPDLPLRGEVLTPLSVIGFTLMGALLVSTLISLPVIQTAMTVAGIIGIAALLTGAAIRLGYLHLPVRTDFIALFCLTALVGLWMAAGEREKLLDVRQNFAGESLTFYGEVCAVEGRENGGSRFLIREAELTAEDGRTGKADVLFYTDGELSFCGGERVLLQGTASDEISISQIGNGAQLVVFRAEFLSEEEPSFWYPLYRWRAEAESRIKTHLRTVLDSGDTALMMGMLMGNSAQISPQDYTLLQNAGLAHLLAVSGLHIAIFFSLVGKLLHRFGRRATLAVSMPVTAVYVFLTGMSVSSVRALVMVSLFSIAELLHLPKNNGSVLGTAVILFCLWEPMCVVQVGTLLSILSVWCLQSVAPAIEARYSREMRFRFILDMAAVCTAISAVTLPVMMLVTGCIPLLAPVCSVLVLPLMPVVLTAGIIAGIFGGLLPGQMAGILLKILLWFIRAVSGIGSNGPMIPLGGELVKAGIAAVCLLVIGLAAICGIRQISLHRELVVSLAAVLLSVTALCAVLPKPQTVEVSSLQGALIIRKGAQAVVIGSGNSDYAGQTIAGYLRANGVTGYSLLIPEGRMTFTGGCYELLCRFPADRLLYTEMESRLQLALERFPPEETGIISGVSEWLLFGELGLEIRPGNNGPYLLLTGGETTILLSDHKDPAIYPADWTVYYDAPADTLSSFAENCGILGVTASHFKAEEEMPSWEAGFLLPDWTVVMDDRLYLLPG